MKWKTEVLFRIKFFVLPNAESCLWLRAFPWNKLLSTASDRKKICRGTWETWKLKNTNKHREINKLNKYTNLLNTKKKVNPLCKCKFSKRKKFSHFWTLILELVTKIFKFLCGDFFKWKGIAKAIHKNCKKEEERC